MPSPPKPANRTKGIFLLALAIVTLFGVSHLGRHWLSSRHPATESPPPFSNQRIIALSPSSVEIIYQLGLDDQLVGISRYCSFPPEAAEKSVVGGYLDLDFEKVLRLHPDTVILLREQKALAERLEQLGIDTLSVDHASTTGITQSITEIGEAFGKDQIANDIVNKIEDRLNQITATKDQREQKFRVLISIDRDTSAAHPDYLIAAGQEGVHQEYLAMVGAINAYDGPAAYPSISREKLIHLDPDIIIDLIDADTWKKVGEEKLLAQWSAYSELKAVQNGRIIILHEQRHMIPGPRFVDTVETISQALRSLPSP